MISAYSTLSPSVQTRILASFRHAQGMIWREGSEKALHLDHFVMLRACLDGDLQAIDELLDFGLSMDFIPSHDSSSGTCPLIWASRAKDPLSCMRFLLARGANPNVLVDKMGSVNVSPLHDTVIQPELIALLLEYQGNPNLKSQAGYTLMDAWLNAVCSAPANATEDALSALDLLLEAGLDRNQPVHERKGFLVGCWTSERKDLVPALLDRGWDPNAKISLPKPGKSLVQYLIDHPGNAKGRQLLAHIQARELQSATLQSSSMSTIPRL